MEIPPSTGLSLVLLGLGAVVVRTPTTKSLRHPVVVGRLRILEVVMIHAAIVIVLVVWLLATVIGGASDDPNAGVMRRWLDDEEFKNGR